MRPQSAKDANLRGCQGLFFILFYFLREIGGRPIKPLYWLRAPFVMATLSLGGRFFRRENSHHPKLGLGVPFCRFPVNLPKKEDFFFFAFLGCGKRRVSATAAAAHFEFRVLFTLFYGILCVRSWCSTCMMVSGKCKNQFYYATASLCFPANPIVSPVQKKAGRYFFLANIFDKYFLRPLRSTALEYIFCVKRLILLLYSEFCGEVWGAMVMAQLA